MNIKYLLSWLYSQINAVSAAVFELFLYAGLPFVKSFSRFPMQINPRFYFGFALFIAFVRALKKEKLCR